MTITVSILVPDGIVLLADSRQVVTSPVSGSQRVGSDNAEKIFQLGPCLAASVCGQGTFYSNATDSPRSIRSLLQSAASGLPENYTVEQAACILQERMSAFLDQHQAATNGQTDDGVIFQVAGYNPNDEIGELYECNIPGRVALERTTRDAGMLWNGQSGMIDRLILGFDKRFFEFLKPEDCGSETASEDLFQRQRSRLQLHIDYQTMPLQDAIDLGVLLVRTTIDLLRLSDGITGAPGRFPACGGAIDVAIITPGDGFRWIQQKQLGVQPL